MRDSEPLTPLTEAEAWREIARRLGEGKEFACGICYESVLLKDEGHIPARMSVRMYARALRHCYRDGLYAYPLGTEREARILAALWLALEAEEDAR